MRTYKEKLISATETVTITVENTMTKEMEVVNLEAVASEIASILANRYLNFEKAFSLTGTVTPTTTFTVAKENLFEQAATIIVSASSSIAKEMGTVIVELFENVQVAAQIVVTLPVSALDLAFALGAFGTVIGVIAFALVLTSNREDHGK